jgi:hypothetical protein
MSSPAKFSTTEELVPFLVSLRSTQVATIVAITEVKMRKTGNPFVGGVRKVQTIKVEVNNNYENKVNDARDAEGKETDFEVAPLQWGEHVSNAVIENNGQLYLQTLVLERDANASYIDANGNYVDYADVKPFMPAYSPAKRQQLDDEVKVRTWKLSSIYDMWMGDKHIYKASGVVGPSANV